MCAIAVRLKITCMSEFLRLHQYYSFQKMKSVMFMEAVKIRNITSNCVSEKLVIICNKF